MLWRSRNKTNPVYWNDRKTSFHDSRLHTCKCGISQIIGGFSVIGLSSVSGCATSVTHLQSVLPKLISHPKANFLNYLKKDKEAWNYSEIFLVTLVKYDLVIKFTRVFERTWKIYYLKLFTSRWISMTWHFFSERD